MCLYYRTARPPNDLLNWSRHHFGNCLASLGRCNDLSSDKICTSSFWNCLHRNILFCSPDITTISHHIISLWAAIILYLTPQKSSLTTEQNVWSNVTAPPPLTLLPRVTRLSKIIPELIWLYTHSPSNIDLLTWQNKCNLVIIICFTANFDVCSFCVLILSQVIVLRELEHRAQLASHTNV